MRLEGTAFLALWNGVQRAALDAYEDWHSREHVPERLTVPGILGAWRYRDSDPAEPGFFTLYDLADVAVLEGAPYQRLLTHPTPASTQMRPKLTGLTRIVCRLDSSDAGPDGAFLLSLVLGPGSSMSVRSFGTRYHEGIIDTEAAGHPLSKAPPAPGRVVMMEGDSERAVRAAAGDGPPGLRVFTLIEAVAPAA